MGAVRKDLYIQSFLLQTADLARFWFISENGNLIHHFFSYGVTQTNIYSYYIFDDEWNLVRLHGLQIFNIGDLSELPDDWAERNPDMQEIGIYHFTFTMRDGVEYRQQIDRGEFLDAFREMLGTYFYSMAPDWYRHHRARLELEFYSAPPTIDLLNIIQRGQYGITWEMNQNLPENFERYIPEPFLGWSRFEYPIFCTFPNAEFTDTINQIINDFVYQYYYFFLANLEYGEEIIVYPTFGASAEVIFANPQLVSIYISSGVTFYRAWGDFTTLNFNPTTGEFYSTMDFVNLRRFVEENILDGRDLSDCCCHMTLIHQFKSDAIFAEDGVTLFRRFFGGRAGAHSVYHFTFEELAPFLHTND